jgi:cytochrome c oxidase subunit IV
MKLSARAYVVTFAALVLLAVLSLVLSLVELPRAALPLSLVIAACKALLVLFVFMHLAEQRFSHRATMLVSAGFVALLIGLTVADVASRRTFPAGSRPPLHDPFYIR